MKRISPIQNAISLWNIILMLILVSVLGACKEKQALVEETETVEQVEEVRTPVLPVIHPEPAQSKGDSVYFRYSRTACFGTCPIFDLVIYEDLHATYHGENFVDRMGDYEAMVEPSQITRLMIAAQSVDYFNLKDRYDDPMVTDLPSAITELRGEDGLKRVNNRYQGPPAMRDFYKVADQIINEIEWKPIENNK